jgi:two-component SAPR family response regulator
MKISSNEEFFKRLDGLIKSLEQGGNQEALSIIRKGLPLPTLFSEEWWKLLGALREVQDKSYKSLTEREREELAVLITAIEEILN